MSTICDITFDNRLKVYSAGQWLRGNVRLVLEEEKKVRGIYVRIWGRAYATLLRNGKTTYKGKEDYVNEKIYFVGGEHGEVRVSPGEHLYNFQCLLPPGLPTSCEGKIGYIRYSVNVVLDIPLWPDTEFEELFTVIKTVDLNEDRAIREPNIYQNSQTFRPCCFICCCQSDPLHIRVRTPVKGYTPGQTVNVDVEVENKSNQRIEEFTVKLIKKINYRNLKLDSYINPVRQKHEETFTIIEKNAIGCNEHQEQTFCVNFVIPPIPPTDVTTSTIMKVEYYFEIAGITSFFHMNPTANLPIIIGTYPIQDNANGKTNLNVDHNDQSSSNGTSNVPLINDDSPNYEEAMYLDNTGANGYKPLYPVFTQKTSY